ncbi:MGT2 magnesium transporter [Trypanosoma conorhini]|uniref:MGT2 magnesium transporter n=1 Tax=Trypanosoma conorhini TaxID=83891 RepID=A0A422N6P8_9TRYP|nr:MGT2 magnesium transporter [Trypanosoma conorhini]RNF01102.1 MGT2 magnesium transporter [Trypanosoma conorhini]
MPEGGEAAGVRGLAMDARPAEPAAIGVVQAMQRCLVFCRPAEAPFSTAVFCNPEGAVKDVRRQLQNGGGAPDGLCVWVDMQGCTEEQHRNMLQLLFPGMEAGQLEGVLSPDTHDTVELRPGKWECLIGGIACSPSRVPSLSAPAASDPEENTVLCSFACGDRFLLTMHAAPFVGLAELLRHVEVEGGLGQRGDKAAPAGAPLLEVQTSGASASLQRRTTSAGILSLLVCFACEAFLPDPTSLLTEVGSIDEMVLLIAPGKQDQTDLLRRVALLRRRIADFRMGLYFKEKLLQELIAPTMRSSFVAKESNTVQAYKEALNKVGQVSGRLDDARDMLNQANLNFVSGISMRMLQGSAVLDFKMTILNQVAAVFLPIHLVISLFGMNCMVPFHKDAYPTLTAFWVICAGFALWFLLFMAPLFVDTIRGLRSPPVAPYS